MTNNDPLSQYNPTDARAVWELIHSVFDPEDDLSEMIRLAHKLPDNVKKYARSGAWRNPND